MKILITERFLPEAEFKLKELGHTVKRSALYAKPTQAEITDAEIMIIRSKTQIHQKFLEQALNLRFLISLTSGVDHIDASSCQKQNIQWTHTPDAHRVSTGELTIALALQALRHLHKIDLSTGQIPLDRHVFIGSEIYQKTWGIVGLGRVGSYVAKLAQGFGADVLAYDPYITDQVFKDNKAERVSLPELFKGSDIVSLHVPYTKETHHFIHLDLLKDLGPEGLLINMARKQVLSIDVLQEALRYNHIGMVALDVFDMAKIIKSQLLSFPNVILSPHLGSATKEASSQAAYKAVQLIQKWTMTL